LSEKMGRARYLFTAIDYFFLGYFYLVRGLAYVLPPRLLYAIFTGFGYALYYTIPGTRKRVCSNIKAAMPELDDKAIRRIGRESYGELLKDMPDLAIFARYRERIWDEMTVDITEEIDKELAKGKGGICVCAHIGAWAISIGMMAHIGYKGTPILMNPEKALTPRLIKAVEDYADAIGVSSGYIVTGEGSVEEGRKALKLGNVIVITIDVIGSRAVEFFGRPAALGSGVGHFACDTGAPMATGRIMRDKKNPLKHHIAFGLPMEHKLTGDRETDVQIIMQTCAQAIEEQIRETPEQWTQWGALGSWWKRAEKLAQQGKD